MPAEKAGRKRLIWWVLIVWTLSFLCYFPSLLKNNGITVPDIVIQAKNLFVLIPLTVSIAFEARNHTLKQWWADLFAHERTAEAFFLSGVLTGIGLGISILCFPDTVRTQYPNAAVILSTSGYLFLMALLEESSWRGFLLRNSDQKRNKFQNIIFVGIAWGLWHIPMWRSHFLSGYDILFYFSWAFLVGIVLGAAYYRYRNLLLLALLHTIFNTCFLAPVQWNIVIMLIFLLVAGSCKILKNARNRTRNSL